MRIGAHVSAAGSLVSTMDRAATIGAECAQIFVGAPQRWAQARYTDDDVSAFRERAGALGIGPNVVHAPYLVNLASPDPALRDRSIATLIAQASWCDRMAIMGLIVHVGSGKGQLTQDECLEFVIGGIEQVLAQSSSTAFLIENTAGMGTSVGSSFAEIGQIVRGLGGDDRVRVCLDTAHTFEAGYEISTRDGLERVLDEFDRHVGIDRIAAVHANDSKTAFGSNVDRHENIGRGCIGEEALGYFMTHSAVQNLPFYLEVPGLDGHGPDRPNIAALRRLAGLPSLPEEAV
ncbi:MAG TPA: deoxyribonuclease IV [Chloroflexota bacterium]|nr:deoxyribonuclease IV [Chloroflexota bacterium]